VNDTDFEEFAKAIAGLAELYGQRLTSKKVTLFFEACRELSLAQVVEAVKRRMRSERFFPSPVELFEALYGTFEDQAMMAWGDVLWAVTHCGASRPVKFADYRIHFSLEHMGGWPCVALAVKEGQGWAFKDFKMWYVFALKRGVSPDEVRPYLPGNGPIPYGVTAQDIEAHAQVIPAKEGTYLSRMGLN